MCLEVVIPSLFPFFVLSRLSVAYLKGSLKTGFLGTLLSRIIGLRTFLLPTLLLGYLSGYPTGAKLARDLWEEGYIDHEEASRIIAFANNCSPLFLIATVGTGFFKSATIGFLLLGVHWLSGLLSMLVLNHVFNYSKSNRITSANPAALSRSTAMTGKKSLFSLMPAAIEDAAILSIRVMGYIVFFAVAADLLSRLGILTLPSTLLSLLSPNAALRSIGELSSSCMRGLLEITSGSLVISQIHGASLAGKLALVSLVCGFAGLSVHMQVMGIMKDTGAKYSTFIKGKLLHGCFAFIIAYLSPLLLPGVFTASIEASAPQQTAFRSPGVLTGLTLILLFLGLIAVPLIRKPVRMGRH